MISRDEKKKLIFQVAGTLLGAQFQQIKIWKSGDEDIARLESFCVESAFAVWCDVERRIDGTHVDDAEDLFS